MEECFSTKEVAERYRIPVTTVQLWIREKKLPAIRLGNQYRVLESDLRLFEEKRRTFSDAEE